MKLLTKEKITNIFDAFIHEDKTMAEIAKEYDVGTSTVSRLLNGKIYTDIIQAIDKQIIRKTKKKIEEEAESKSLEARKKKAEEEFRSFGLYPVDMSDWQNLRSKITCQSANGFKMHASIEKLREGYYPTPFFKNPYADENLQKLANEKGIQLLEGQKYVDYQSDFYGTNEEEYIVKFTIQQLRKDKITSPFSRHNKYALHNAELLCQKLGLRLLINPKQEYKGVTYNIYGVDERGHKHTFKISDLQNGIIPSSFQIDTFEKYGYTPLDLSNWKNGSSVIKCLDKDGMIVRTSIKRLKSGAKPNPFKKNPYALENIKTLCKKQNITLLDNQKYTGYHAPYYGYQDDYMVKFSIDSLLKAVTLSPFAVGNKYALQNIETLCSKNGLSIKIKINIKLA